MRASSFASPEIYDYLEAEGMLYAIRLPANKVLQESIAHLLRVSLCSFPYPGRRLWHAYPTLGSARALAIRIPLG